MTATMTGDQVLFLRQAKNIPQPLDPEAKTLFRQKAEEISASIDDPDFWEGTRQVSLPPSFNGVMLDTIKSWCVHDGWPVEIESHGSEGYILTVRHPPRPRP